MLGAQREGVAQIFVQCVRVCACFALLLVLAADLRKGRIRGKRTQLEGDGRSTNDYPGLVQITETLLHSYVARSLAS